MSSPVACVQAQRLCGINCIRNNVWQFNYRPHVDSSTDTQPYILSDTQQHTQTECKKSDIQCECRETNYKWIMEFFYYKSLQFCRESAKKKHEHNRLQNTYEYNFKSEFQLSMWQCLCNAYSHLHSLWPNKRRMLMWLIRTEFIFTSFQSIRWLETVQFRRGLIFLWIFIANLTFRFLLIFFLTFLNIQNDWTTNEKDESVDRFGSTEGNHNDCRRYRWLRRYVFQCFTINSHCIWQMVFSFIDNMWCMV